MDVINRASRVIASEARQGAASGTGQTPEVYRCPSPPYSQYLQNKQCFHNLYAHLSAARNILNALASDIVIAVPATRPSRLRHGGHRLRKN